MAVPLRSSLIAGVDGCPAGWICLTRDQPTGRLDAAVYPNAATLIARRPQPEVLAIDIPIGSPDAGERSCDTEARRLLGRPRGSSVFPAPIRQAIDAGTYEAACQITTQADGRGVSKQTWAIIPKIRQIDQLLNVDPVARDRFHEVHPEICFWAWNERCAMAHNKRSCEGRTERRALIDAHFGPLAACQVRQQFRTRDVADDDIHDAFAALWTAERIIAGQAVVIPEVPAVDSAGRRMGMWY